MPVFWSGRGYWVVFLATLAAFVPMIVLRQVDGPEVDQGVSFAMALAAAATFGFGLRWNRGVTFGAAAQEHAMWGIPLQVWAVPLLLFAILLGSGIITTAEGPRPRAAAPTGPGSPSR